ncbi:unnamed protein product [Medioppia subpectinata]|uniref:BHLH domain-containing protein n=1 Tax=Medioppia subpectinata TaxID=1979941 RepID=A0A7R9Q496_9ACAR|nr:unnamed protein product [Medioppia subpectinata]CAG2112405.1 unnamed protein product [Medioppia subpectinata]
MIKYFEDQPDCPALNSYQRLTKPLIEKRRRARINLCLTQLKEMIIDSGRHNIQNPKCKYEKADILELTVEYLQNMHFKQQMDKNVSKQSFNAGFDECLKQVQHFMKCLPLSDKLNNKTADNTTDRTQISQKLLTHLDFCRLELTHSDVDNDMDGQKEMTVDTDIDIDRYYDQNISAPNPSYSVIQHTRNYSSSVSSASSSSSTTGTVSPPTTPEPQRRPLPDTLPPDFIPEFRSMRANSVGLYESDRNGQCYELGADGVWRPW